MLYPHKAPPEDPRQNPHREIPAVSPGRPPEIESLLVGALRAGRGITLIAQGNSMMPLLRAGSVVRVEPADRALRGEVVAVQRPDGGLALHRVVAHEGALVVTWGDALPAPDAWGPSAVLGRLVSPVASLFPLPSLLAARSWRARLHLALGPRKAFLALWTASARLRAP